MGAENPIALMLAKLAVSDEPSTSHNPYGPIGRPRVASNSSQSDCRRTVSISSSSGVTSGRSSALLLTPPPSPPNAFLNSQMKPYSPFGNGTSASQAGPFSGPGFRMYSPGCAFASAGSPVPPFHQQRQQVFPQPRPLQPVQPVRQSEEDIELEVFRELQALRSSVPDDYVCHRCNQKGHWIKFCPTKNPSNERTPYQGDRPSIGFFRCGCTRQWKADAQRNTAMTCRGCRQSVFPYKMMKKSA